MKHTDVIPQIGVEEVFYLVDVYSHGKLLGKEVKAKLIINSLRPGESKVYLYPKKECYKKISSAFEFQIKGLLRDIDGNQRQSIFVERGTQDGGIEHHGNFDLYDDFVRIHPETIERRIFLERRNPYSPERESELRFFISENKAVLPIKGLFRGAKEIKREYLSSPITLTAQDRWSLTFDVGMFSEERNIDGYEGLFVYEKQSVGIKTKGVFTKKDLDGIIQILDKLLSYLSFWSRQKTTWVAWSGDRENDSVHYWRCNITYPIANAEYNELMHDRQLTQKFLQHCLDRIGMPQSTLDLSLPLIYLTNVGNKTVEAQFLFLFMGLEALLNIHQKSIGIQNPDNKKFREKFDKYCQDYKVEILMFWPMIGKKSEITLYKIRNDLAHGNTYDHSDYLVDATFHLQWTLERCLFAALDWDGPTPTDRKYLVRYSMLNTWKRFFKKAEFN